MNDAPAQQAGTATSSAHSAEATFRSTTNLVVLDVTALDPATGLPETHFTQRDFEVFDNGKLVSIRTFDAGLQSRPLALWFVVQCRMQGWETQGSALFSGQAHSFLVPLQHLNKTDRVGVAHWCDDGQSRIDLTPSANAGQAVQSLEYALASVEQIDSHGRSGELALQRALQRIIEATGALPGQPIPVIVFLYGDFSGMPKSEANHFVGALLSTTAIVLICDVRSPRMKELALLGGEQGSVANYLATQTGGQYFRVSNDQYGTVLDRILNELHSRYELGFQPGTLDGKRHRLRVKLVEAGQIRRKGVRLRYRSGYVSVPSGTE